MRKTWSFYEIGFMISGERIVNGKEGKEKEG
jgi:hypothetical protein